MTPTRTGSSGRDSMAGRNSTARRTPSARNTSVRNASARAGAARGSSAGSARRSAGRNGRPTASRSSKSMRSQIARKPARAKKAKLGRIDVSFFFLVIVLVTIGLIMVFSASYATSLYESNSGLTLVKKQCLFVGMGLVAMYLLSYIPYHLYLRMYKVIYFGCLGLTALALAFKDAGNASTSGARRWIPLGPFGTFQPSELMKFGLIVVFAALISINYRQMNTLKKGILPFFIYLIPVLVVIALQRHMSCIMLMVLICGAMMFVAGSKIYYLAALVPVGLIGLVILQAMGFNYIGTRIDTWLDPFSDITGSTWQVVQSIYAIGSGGLFGVGLGNSTQKFLWVSEPQNDFIFAIVCEELGLIGALAIILLFILFVASGFSIAMRAPDKFSSMVVIGVVFQFGIQALLNIAVVSNAMPTTGIPLPFFSAGGSATLMQLGQIGVVLNISRYCRPAISRKKDPGPSDGDKQKQPEIKIISSREL